MNVKVYKRYYGMVLGISIHLDFYRLCEQTIKLKVGELYSRCIIVSSNTLLKVLFFTYLLPYQIHFSHALHLIMFHLKMHILNSNLHDSQDVA